MLPLSEQDFPRTDRFVIRRRLGAGTFGVVYEAYDQLHGRIVALKSLRRLNPVAIYHFKQEFRALSDIIHPNLVSLYELISLHDQWFFTMELVSGTDFLSYVREGAPQDLAEDTTIAASESPTAPEGQERQILPIELPPLDLTRLRSALAQLAEGIFALHQAGKLHRDLKPSNVLVTEEGRVVVLDFGLVTELKDASTPEAGIVGTVAYMSPEQAGAQPLTEASDWYSVGVMLYQALSGTLPFVGDVQEILKNKRQFAPPDLRNLDPSLPEDLSDLAMELLRRNPARRPSGEEILRRLGAERWSAPRTRVPFVGREEQLHALQAAFQEVKKGKALIVSLYGASGMGKSTLLRLFLDEVSSEPGNVVLSGRCYERESVPYKALDSLLDSLCRHLASLPLPTVLALLPEEIHALARMFPVLLRVPAIAQRPAPAMAPDVKELRQRAFGALRELLHRMSQLSPLVLLIDDAQWGDEDSAALLDEIVRPPCPPFLLLLAYRQEEQEESTFLQAFLGTKRPRGAEIRTVEVAPLATHEALDLTLLLLGDDDLTTQLRPDLIARESGGNPYFVDELVRYAREDARRLTERSGSRGAITLEEVLEARLSGLPEEPRLLLDVVAVAGRPLTLQVALAAAGLSEAAGTRALARLHSGRLIEARGPRLDDLIECYHDRIRHTAVALCPPEKQREYHRRLAEIFSASKTDPEALVHHLRGAGEEARAAEYAVLAANAAAEALAFSRAVRLYRLALELSPSPPPLSLRVRLAESLANAGRSHEAAKTYLEAAKEAPEGEVNTLQERAAYELLRSGHVDEALDTIRPVLEATGLPLAKSPGRALLSVLWSRVKIELRGLKFEEREKAQLDPEELRRIDLCWMLTIGLGNIDTVRGADFQGRHMLLALRAGEPYRVARALCAEAAFLAAEGGKKQKKIEEIIATASDLVARLENPYTDGFLQMITGEVGFLIGQWKRACNALRRAEDIFRSRCNGVSWEIATSQFYLLGSLFYLGDVKELSQRQPESIRTAEERGDLYAATLLRSGHCAIPWLVVDKPEEARRQVLEATRRWSPSGFHVQHFTDLLMQAEIDLYCHEGQRAYERVSERWKLLTKSLLLQQIQVVRTEALQLRARSALAFALSQKNPGPFLQIAEKDAKAIEKEKMPWSAPMALLLRAAVCAQRGAKEDAAALLVGAVEGFSAADMALYAACTRYRLAPLLGGEKEKILKAEADAFIKEQTIQNPEGFCEMLAPGFPK